MTHASCNRTSRCLLCLALVITMLLSLAACRTAPATTGVAPSQNLQVSTTVPVIKPTQPTVPSTPATQPSTTQPPTTQLPTTQPDDPPVTPSKELVFTLTQADVDEYYALLSQCEVLALEGQDLQAIENATQALDESYAYLDAQRSIANILYYSNMSVKLLENQYLDSVEICTEANDAYVQMTRRVYLSDSPAKDILFEDWTAEDIAHLLAYDEQIAQLQKRNAEIAVDYRAAADDDQRIPLYIEFVQNNNQIARLYGYDNYYIFAYEAVYNRDYAPEELDKMRSFAKTYLADIYETALTNFYNSFYGLNSQKQMIVLSFLEGDYNTLSADYVSMYLDAMPASLSDTIRTMLTEDSLFADSPNAMPGAFTTTIGDRSYCFFGPGYANCTTVIHEGGHYYASRYADLEETPLDLAETHSQGNEWLFLQYLESQMGADRHNAIVDYRLFEDLAMIMVCLMVDEFEQRVYTTDVTGFTAEDFDAIMDSVSAKYFPSGHAAHSMTDMNAYWRMVVVEQPVYYVSYAVSSIAAIDLYTVAAEDFDAAVAIYQKLCEEPVLESGFLGNILAAGLSGPFQEEFYKELCQIIRSRS